MGTSKPLTIYIHPSLEGQPWVIELTNKGHICYTPKFPETSVWEADLILGPTCWRWVPGMEAHLDTLLKGARKIKYPKEKP